MTVKNWFIILTFLFPSLFVKAQNLIFKNVSDQLGLPSKECYGIFQDSRGFFWINTDMGLVKCCKTSSILFDNKNGIDENAVYYLNENENKEIEIITAGNRFLKIKNNKVIETKQTKSILDFLKFEDEKYNENTFSLIYFLTRNDKGDLLFTTQRGTYLINNGQKSMKIHPGVHKRNNDNILIDLIIEEKTASIVKHLDSRPIKQFILKNGKYTFRVQHKGKRRFIEVPINNNSHIDWRVRCTKVNGKTIINIHNTVVVIDNYLNYEILTFPSVVLSIYANPKSGLWVGTTVNGVYHFPSFNNLKKFTIGLSGLSVSSTYVDIEGSVWCTTLEQGVFSSKSDDFEQILSLAPVNSKITLLKNDGNDLFVSSKVDELTVYRTGFQKTINLLKVGSIEITDFLRFKGNNFIASKGYIGKLNTSFELVKKFLDKENFNNVLAYQLDTTKNQLYALGVAFIFKIEGGFLKTVTSKFESKASCFKMVNDDLAYVGTSKGLFRVGLKDKRNYKIKGIESKVSKIIKLTDNSFFVITQGEGLFQLNNEKLIPVQLFENIYQMTDIVEYQYNHFFIACPQGLLEVKRKANKYYSHLYNSADGLISDFVEHLTVHNDHLYLSGYDGVLKLNPSFLRQNKTIPTFYFRQKFVNNKLVKTNKLNLNYDQNNLRFEIDLTQFKTGKKEGVYFKLEGRDKAFKKSETNILSFDNLPPGGYKLIVFIRNSDGVQSVKKSISFKINLPIWREWWFVFLLVSSIIGLTVLIVNSIVKSIKKREQEKTELYRLVEESKLTALQAQMNPHFIFNAINSIQNFILNKKELDAYSYLAKFSKLIRIVLNNVGNHNHTLEEELDLLNLYIELEKMRFEKSFIFKVSIDEEIEIEDVLVPVLLIQPYVENAIWHGLMPLDSSKSAQLSLKITSYKDYLKIEIIDNGIGRKKSLKMKEGKLHHSKGMSLTKQRIEVMGKMTHQNKVSVTVVDLKDESGNPAGTNVQLIIPYSLEN